MAALVAAALATAGIGARLLYRDFDLATEMLVYAHGTPDLHRVVAVLAERQAAKPAGHRLVVAHDNATSWPLLWYLRDTEHRYLVKEPTAADLADVDLLLLSPETSRKAWGLVARDFEERELLQLWWPVEAYRDPARLADPAARRAALEYFVSRRLPGVSVGPLWPLRQPLRLLERRPGPARGPVPALELSPMPLELGRDPETDRPLGSGAATPVAVAADEAGRVVVGDLASRSLLRFDRTFRALAAVGVVEGLAPSALAASGDGTVAVADAAAGVVLRLDGTGGELARWGDRQGREVRRTGAARPGSWRWRGATR